MKTIYIALMLIFTGSAFAELTTEYPDTNTVRISRNGELLLVKSTSSDTRFDLVFFKNQQVLYRLDRKDFTSQIFPPNAPVSVSLDDEDHDGHPDRVQLFTVDGAHQTIHDLLHIGTDGRLEPFSDQELQAEQEIYSDMKDSKQNEAEETTVSVSVQNCPLDIAVESFSELLGKPVIIDEGIYESITIQIEGPTSKNKALALLNAALEEYSLTLEPQPDGSQKVIRISKTTLNDVQK
jgi:hypothetical protein